MSHLATQEPTVRFSREIVADDAPFNTAPFDMIGVRAKAEFLVPCGQLSSTRYVIHSAGLWGIEVDSPESYIEKIYQEQLTELKHDLRVMASTINGVR